MAELAKARSTYLKRDIKELANTSSQKQNIKLSKDGYWWKIKW